MRRDEVTSPRRMVPIIQYFVIPAVQNNTGVSEFRVRCFQPLSHLSVAAKGANILPVGGYVSNVRRLNKNGLSPSRVIVAFDRGDTSEDLSDESRTVVRPRSRRASR